MTTHTKTRCAIYIRVSSKMQLDGHSLEAQRDLCHKFAASRNWEVVSVFEGEGESAKTDKRKAFQEMVGFVERGGADVVLTHKIDRFARNVVDALTYFYKWNAMGVTYASATEQFDFTTPWGRMMLVMLAAFAELFLNNLSSEVAKGKRKRAEKGFWNGDLAFGYRVAADGIHAEEDPATAPGVRLAFQTYAAGGSNAIDIARMLNSAGYRTVAKGKRASITFSKDTVSAMLKNQFYCGRVTYKGEMFPGQHPALIDDELFQKCQAVRNSRSLKPRRAKCTARIYVLSGLLVCADCGRVLRGQFTKKRIYRDPDRDFSGTCPNHPYYDGEKTENELVNTLVNLTLPDEWTGAIAKMASREIRQDDVLKRRARAEAKLRRARELYVEGDLSPVEYDAWKREAMAEIESLKPVPKPDIERARALLADLPRLISVATDLEKQRLFQSILERVVVSNGAIVALQPTRDMFALMSVCFRRTRRVSDFVGTTALPHILPPATPLSRVVPLLKAIARS